MKRQIDYIELLLQVARAYYEQGLTQSDIAHAMEISRTQISRYLQEARDLGIVQIRVINPNDGDVSLETQLQARFETLQAAVVVPIVNRRENILLQMLGQACANYLKSAIAVGDCLCTGGGRAVSATIKALRSFPIKDLKVVQAMGSMGHEVLNIDFNEMVRVAAGAFRGRAYYLSAPAILGLGTMLELENNNASIRESLARARNADVYLVGIGTLDRDQLYVRNNLITQADINLLREQQVVGDICARFFLADGTEYISPFSERIVGITLQHLKNARLAIAVVGGADKVNALRAALKGGWINMVVTDDETARAVLSLDDTLRRQEK